MQTLSASLIGVIAILIFGLLLFAAAWLASGRMLARRSPDPARTPADLGLAYEKVVFASRDGIKLVGRLTTVQSPNKENRSAIIFCAGMFGSMDGDTDLIPIFTDAGYDVLQFDWRAHGQSDGAQGSLGLREPLDVLGALDFLELRGIKRVGLMGFSFGGAVALRAVALDHRPLAVACDGGFVRLGHSVEGLLAERIGPLGATLLRPLVGLTMLTTGLRLHDTLRRAEPLDTAAQVAPRPILLIHGQEDAIVPASDQDDLFTRCSDPKSMWRVDGAGHREAHLRQPEEYRRHIVEFFQAHLS